MKLITAAETARLLDVSERTVRRAIARNPSLASTSMANERGKPSPLVNPEEVAASLRLLCRPAWHVFESACAAAGCDSLDVLARIFSAAARDGFFDADLTAAFFREIYSASNVTAIESSGRLRAAPSLLIEMMMPGFSPVSKWTAFLASRLRDAAPQALLAMLPKDLPGCWTVVRRKAAGNFRFFAGKVIVLSNADTAETSLVVTPDFIREAQNADPEFRTDRESLCSLGFKPVPISGDVMAALWTISPDGTRAAVNPAALIALTGAICALREDSFTGEDTYESGAEFSDEIKSAIDVLRGLGVKKPAAVVGRFLRAWRNVRDGKPLPIRLMNQIFHLSTGAR